MRKEKAFRRPPTPPTGVLPVFFGLILVAVTAALVMIPTARAATDKEGGELVGVPIVESPRNSEPEPGKPPEALPPAEEPAEVAAEEPKDTSPAVSTAAAPPASPRSPYTSRYAEEPVEPESRAVAGTSTAPSVPSTPAVASSLPAQITPVESVRRSSVSTLTGILSGVVILSLSTSFALYLAKVQEEL